MRETEEECVAMDKFINFVKTRTGIVHDAIAARIKTDSADSRMAREFIDGGRFYLRPGLMFLASLLYGSTETDALLPAIAIQLSNEWMLIHDDIEDQALLRRGKPALHEMFGIAAALNTGDYLQAESWKAICEYLLVAKGGRGRLMESKFGDIIRVTIGAQALDIEFSHSRKALDSMDNRLYYSIAAGKGSYYSVYGPLQMGAIAAGESGATLDMIEEIAKPAGVAAQIQNDILDMTEKPKSGRQYQDLYEGKITPMLINTFKCANESERERMRHTYSKRQSEKSEEEISDLVGLYEKYNSVDYAEDKKNEYGAEAEAMLEKHKDRIPDNEFKEVFIAAINAQYKNYQHT